MDSYRGEKRAMRKIILEDEDGEIDPVRTGGGGGRGEVEIDRLSAIIEEFNDRPPSGRSGSNGGYFPSG